MAEATTPRLIIADIGSGYLVMEGKQTRIVGKTPYTRLKFGACGGKIDASFRGFKASEIDGSVVLSNEGRSVPVTTGIQEMAEGFLSSNAALLLEVWQRNRERVRRLFSS